MTFGNEGKKKNAEDLLDKRKKPRRRKMRSTIKMKWPQIPQPFQIILAVHVEKNI